jgi:steroid delta-isomerase-like uncharacterized protein
MSAKQNKAIARRFVEASVISDPAPVTTLLAPDFVAHQPGRTQNREEFVRHLTTFLNAFSESYFDIEQQIAEDELVVTRGTWGGTHSGRFQGLPPTGKQVAINAVLVDRIKDGKIVEHQGLFDTLSMLQQLGVVPTPEQTN